MGGGGGGGGGGCSLQNWMSKNICQWQIAEIYILNMFNERDYFHSFCPLIQDAIY